MAASLKHLVFLGNFHRKSPQIANHHGDNKLLSGKEKAHKHKKIFPVTARVRGGSPDRVGGFSRPVARGQKFMCCVRNPRNINVFVRVPGREESGSRPGGSVTGVTEKLFMCQMFMCLFQSLYYVIEFKVQQGPLGGCDLFSGCRERALLLCPIYEFPTETPHRRCLCGPLGPPPLNLHLHSSSGAGRKRGTIYKRGRHE